MWDGTIAGTTEGRITHSFDGVARSAFRHNWIGFCVLHPTDAADVTVGMDTPDGHPAARTAYAG